LINIHRSIVTKIELKIKKKRESVEKKECHVKTQKRVLTEEVIIV